MARVVFMGTPDFAVPSLQKLLETQSVVGVVTQPDRPAGRGRKLQPPPVKIVAQKAGVAIYQPESLRSERSVAILADWRPDVIIVAAYGQILRPHVLQLPPKGCLNVHASLLPRWRGASPIQHAILAGDAETGVSLMQLDEGLDTGPVYAKVATAIGPRETAASLHDRLARLGADMLVTHLEDILSGKTAAVPQDNEHASYAPMIKKEDGRVDWDWSSRKIDRLVRAMSPWPGAFTVWQDERLSIRSASPLEDAPDGPAGTVFAPEKMAPDAAAVHTGKGALLLHEVQLAGRRAMTIADFLPGRPGFIGSQLGN